MSANPYYTRPWKLKRYLVGPLRPYLEGFAQCLQARGYAQASGQRYVREVGRLSQWMARRKVGVSELDEEVMIRYSRVRKRGRQCAVQMGPFKLFLHHMRAENILSPAKARLVVGTTDWTERYRAHLVSRRGLAPETVRRHLRLTAGFLRHLANHGDTECSQLQPRHITEYLVRLSTTRCRGGLGEIASALRSFLRFLEFLGEVSSDLVQCVPSVPSWRRANLPSFLEPTEIDSILQQCNTDTPMGLRDRAILLLLVRLGLRAVEVCRLTLDDIDWRVGAIEIRGKAGKHTRLPLTKDVGEAVARYLRRGRPRVSNRFLFLRIVAPHSEGLSSPCIAHIVRRALGRAGIRPARQGSHLLRHTCATQMLRRGASLTDIGQILRHQRPDTTAIYAKVDVDQLRRLAQPWPKGGVS